MRSLLRTSLQGQSGRRIRSSSGKFGLRLCTKATNEAYCWIQRELHQRRAIEATTRRNRLFLQQTLQSQPSSTIHQAEQTETRMTQGYRWQDFLDRKRKKSDTHKFKRIPSEFSKPMRSLIECEKRSHRIISRCQHRENPNSSSLSLQLNLAIATLQTISPDFSVTVRPRS